MNVSHLEILQKMGMAVVSREFDQLPDLPFGSGHAYSTHASMWNYVANWARQPFWGSKNPLFTFLDGGASVAEASRHTRFFVMIGTSPSQAMKEVIAAEGGVKLIFEPSPERVESLVTELGRQRVLQGKPFVFSGDPDSMIPPFMWTIPESVTSAGFPVFFVEEGLRERMPEYVDKVIELLELFYYRHVLYHVAGQDFQRSYPVRPMERKASYDRVLHAYENIAPMLRQGVADSLDGALAGESAILVAAGPALDDKLDWIAENRDRAVVIAVNNSLRTLIRAGIEPHFVVINDTSVDSGRAFADLPPLENSVLVPHCLSSSGNGIFDKMYFWGEDPTGLFPKRRSLPLHGSVITTAFSLAELLGCPRVYLAGVQLASPNPYTLSYSKNSQHGGKAAVARPRIDKWPQLYPVKAADGTEMFTTLNFYDAAKWFLDRIRMSDIKVVNTCANSIVYGDGVEIEESPALPDNPNLAGRLKGVPGPCPPNVELDGILDYLKEEMQWWRERKQASSSIVEGLVRHGEAHIPQALELMQLFDNTNTSFMVHRFGGFDNKQFTRLLFESNATSDQCAALHYYFTHVHAMAKELLDVLKEQMIALHQRS
jgi:hypothetical protein